MNDLKLFSGTANQALSERIAQYLGVPLGRISLGTFPDGEISCKINEDIRGRDVVVCEGVVDSGLTLSFLLDMFRVRSPKSLRVATLLDKVPCRKIDVPVDYAGWKIGNEFVVGYGMDAGERYRNLPYVGVLQEA